MSELAPVTTRPYMPGYGTKPPDQGTGLLPWSWAVEQLNAAKNVWVATIGTQGQPHLSAVWAVWADVQLLFSCATASLKARNLTANPACTVATESAMNSVVLEGEATLVLDTELRRTLCGMMNSKYEAEIPEDFFALDCNAVFALSPVKAFGLVHDDFEGSPTRWTFST